MKAPTALRVLEQGVAAGLHPGFQVYVSLRGQVVLDTALGEARPGTPLGVHHLLVWLSATKPIVALALGRYWQQGQVDLLAPVARYLPAFGQAGKETVTVWQVLTHTGGFRSRVDLDWQDLPWEELVAQVCAAPLERGWVPGERAAYHPASGWIALGAVLERVGGRPCAQILREEILVPLGMGSCWVGMPAEVYHQRSAHLAGLYNTLAKAPQPQVNWEGEEAAVRCLPWAGARGPMRELGRFYEALLAGGGPIVAARTVEHFTSRHRQGLHDHTFGKTIDWGLGFVLDSKTHGPDIPYGYGEHSSPQSYGHGGRQCCVAFADPEAGLVVAAGFNGMPGELAHDHRVRAFLAALYLDLGLAEARQ